MVNGIEIAWPTHDPSAVRATTAAIRSTIVAKHKPAGGSGPIWKVLGVAVESNALCQRPFNIA